MTLKIDRYFSTAGQDPFDSVDWHEVESRLTDDRTGEVIHEALVEAPTSWSQTAVDIISSKYFRRAGVPLLDENGSPRLDETGRPLLGAETSVRQPIHRLAGTWAHWGKDAGYLDEDGAKVFYDEMVWLLLNQRVAPNSPQWFNTGLHWAYGIDNTSAKRYYFDPAKGEVVETRSRYQRPEPLACFLLGIEDNLSEEDGIAEHIGKEIRIFQAGAGAGANFSTLRALGEKLSGGGVSSGLMSFLEVFDRSAGAIQSGGTCLAPHQRVYVALRGPVPVAELAAGPEFLALSWDPPSGRFKVKPAHAWISGRKTVVRITTETGSYEITDDHPVRLADSSVLRAGELKPGQRIQACVITESEDRFRVELGDGTDEDLISLIALDHGGWQSRTARSGRRTIAFQEVQTVEVVGTSDVYDVEVACPTPDDKSPTSGHNFVIWPDDNRAGSGIVVFNTRRAAKMVVVDADHPEIEDFVQWKANEEKKAAALIAAGYDSDWRGEAYRTISGQNANNSVSLSHDFMEALRTDADWALTARTDGRVMRTIKARALWRKIAEAAHASADPGVQFNGTMNDWNPVPHVGRIRTTNPCSEAIQLDSTSCNLASVRLTAFLREDGSFDADALAAASRLTQFVLEISVHMAQFPDAKVALNTHRLRYTGLGYADLGALLMRSGLPYDSDEGRAVAAGVTSVMTAAATRASAELAEVAGPYADYDAANHRRIIEMHQAAHSGHDAVFTGRPYQVQLLDRAAVPEWASELTSKGDELWSDALAAGDEHGYRNVQTSLIAPTGTISLVLDCDTSGVEPDFALVKFKKLAGGGMMKIVNRSTEAALRRLGYNETQIKVISDHILETGVADGAPGLLPEHLAVFDTAVGERSIAPEGHVRMLAAIQPFVSAGISKTINLPSDATPDEIEATHQMAYDLGVKCIAVYRDGSKLSQVLSTSADDAAQAANLADAFRAATPGTSPTEFYRRLELMGVPRFKLQPVRVGRTFEIKVGGTKVFIRTGEYQDGTLGEIFIDLAKEGATLRGVISCFAMAISHGLQSGIPLRLLVDQFTFQAFEPRGMVELHPHVKMATSIIDAVFRILAVQYLGDDTLAQVKLEGEAGSPTPAPATPPKRAAQPAPAKPSHSGETCRCGGLMVRTGSCSTCSQCGDTTGGCQ